jgi:uncharacterized zinc-type alcohol dehydrogenase-like protein
MNTYNRRLTTVRDDNTRTGESKPDGHSRRDFIVSAATAAAAVGATSFLTASTAEGATPTPLGPGPYPTDGMAAYSPAGPHRLMRFQRRALGPKDVAVKIDYAAICHSDIHTIHEDWGKISVSADRRS